MTSQEAGLVLGNVRTCARAENGNLLLDLLDIIFAGLKVNLEAQKVSRR